jgi:integrase
MAAGSVRRLYREVKACWAWAARPEPERVPPVILEKDPIAGMRLPTATRGKPKYVAPAVVRRLIDFAARRANGMTPLRGRFERQAVLMLRFLAETGCRPKEACSARWEELDAERCVLVLGEHKTKRKTGRDRLILIPAGLVAELAAHRDSGHAHPTHLFAHPRSRGQASTTAERETGVPWGRPGYTAWFKKLVREAEKAGLDVPPTITLYWLRHSYLTDAQIAVGAERAADLAGNTKEIARGTYYHAQLEEMRETARKVEERRSGGDAADRS